MENKVDILPMKKKYSELKSDCNNKEFSIVAALSEYIDNSIQSILEDYKEKNNIQEEVISILERNDKFHIEKLKEYNLTVEFELYPEEKYANDPTTYNFTLLVKDNACGIKYNKLYDCMNMSKTVSINYKRNKNSMNKYGVGMKIASFYLGNNAIIYTKTKEDELITLGNYQAPLHKDDKEMDNDIEILMTKLPLNNYDSISKQIKNSGTIIKIESFNHKFVSKLMGENSENNLNNIRKTLGMKYFNYLENDILKIKFLINNKNEVKVKKNSMLVFDADSTKYNPFVISKYFEDKKPDFNNVYEFQNFLKNKLYEICNSGNNKFLNDLYNKNEEFRNIFNDINKPIVFSMNCPIGFNNLDFPIKVCVMLNPEQKYSNVNVLSQWRYIKMPSFERTTNNIIKQFIVRNDWKPDISAKWSFIEFNLKDLPLNENFEYFKVDRNKTDFIENDENESRLDNYDIKTIEDAIFKVKKDLIPFTNIFKNVNSETTTVTLNTENLKNDFLSQQIGKVNDNSFSFTTKNNVIKKIDLNGVNKDKIFDKFDDDEIIINTKNNILKFNNGSEDEKIDTKWILILYKLRKTYDDLESLRSWIKQINNVEYFADFNKIKKILDELDDVEDFEDFIKNV